MTSEASSNGQHPDPNRTPGTAADNSRSGASRSGASMEIHNFLADIEDLIEQTTSITGEDLARAKADISERVAAAKATLGDASAAVEGRVRQAAGDTHAFVQQRPWSAIGLGAAAGFVLGVLLARRA